MDIPRQVRVVLAAVFVGGLGAILLAGLIWAYNPEGRGGVEFVPDTGPADDGAGTATAEPPPEAIATAEEAPGDGGQPAGTPTPTEDADELIAAAADPERTTVQVLEAGGGSGATQAAARELTALGYNVINVTSSRTDVDRTTIWYTSGNEPEARGLRARDGRFAEVGPNERLNEATDLHVLVGPDWRD